MSTRPIKNATGRLASGLTQTRSHRLPGSSAGPDTNARTSHHPPLALAVWPPTSSDRRHTYLAESRGRHRIAPDLAARAILAYTDPGDLVIDPNCGIGTTLVEAIQNGRRAIGIEPDRKQRALATANISHARQQGAPGRAAVIEGDPAQLPRLLPKAAAILNPPSRGDRVRRHPAGSSQLILTAAPGQPTAAALSAWTGVLAPGGFLLLVHTQNAAEPRGSLGTIVSASEEASLQYWQHVIAIRSTETALLHTDVVCFRKPHPDRAVARTQAAGQAVAA